MSLRDPEIPLRAGHAATDCIINAISHRNHREAPVEAEAEAAQVAPGVLVEIESVEGAVEAGLEVARSAIARRILWCSSSLVLADDDDPAALTRFYGALVCVEPQPGLSGTHWRIPWLAGGWLEVYAPSRNRPQPRQQGRLALCLRRQADAGTALAVLHAWISTALELDASLGDPPRQPPPA